VSEWVAGTSVGVPAREANALVVRAGACVGYGCGRVRVCACACGCVCVGGCVGVCPCSEALLLEDRKISEKKSSSGTPAGPC
jgi:hypothetical protein